jgi:rubrerythrin
MGIHFTGREIIDVAVGIEASGAAFYDQVAAGTKKGKTATMFRKLADMEREHAKTFQSMLDPAGDYVNFSPSEEYDAYLRTLVGSAVFTNKRSARESARNAASESEALEIGIRAEKDSILFYSAIQGLMRREDAEVVQRIIKEEQSHLAQLSEVLKRGQALRKGKEQG